MTEHFSMRPPAIALVLFAATLASSCGEAPERGPADEPERTDVQVSEAVRGDAPEIFPATVVAGRVAELATRMTGTLVEVGVDAGSTVRAGQPLLRLDDADVRARVESARSSLALAERSLERVESLHADGAASDQERDVALAAAEAARAGLRDAEAQLDYAVVRAPFDGFVVARLADPGDLAAPGRPLLRVVDRDALHVEADLPGELAGAVRPGTPVRVEVPGAGVHAAARVTRVAPALDAASRRFRVEALFEPPLGPEHGLVHGSYARIEVGTAGAREGSPWIPEDAVVRRGQLAGAFVLEGEQLRLRWLRLGRVREGAVEVLAGPADELTVVRSPSTALRDGQPVGGVTRIAWPGPGSVESQS